MDRADQIQSSRDAILEELQAGRQPDLDRIGREVLKIGTGVALDLARIAAALERIAHHLESE